MKMLRFIAGMVLVVQLLCCISPAIAKTFPTQRGLIVDWLILGPIPNGIMGDTDHEVIDIPFAPLLEADLAIPVEAQTVHIGGRPFTWQRYHGGPWPYAESCDGAINFSVPSPQGQAQPVFPGGWQANNNHTAYAVAYLISDIERKDVKIGIGSDDAAKVWLNGKHIGTANEKRGMKVDNNVWNGLTLKAGVNVVIFKVTDFGAWWNGCLRFLNQQDEPITDVEVSLKPQFKVIEWPKGYLWQPEAVKVQTDANGLLIETEERSFMWLMADENGEPLDIETRFSVLGTVKPGQQSGIPGIWLSLSNLKGETLAIGIGGEWASGIGCYQARYQALRREPGTEAEWRVVATNETFSEKLTGMPQETDYTSKFNLKIRLEHDKASLFRNNGEVVTIPGWAGTGGQRIGLVVDGLRLRLEAFSVKGKEQVVTTAHVEAETKTEKPKGFESLRVIGKEISFVPQGATGFRIKGIKASGPFDVVCDVTLHMPSPQGDRFIRHVDKVTDTVTVNFSDLKAQEKNVFRKLSWTEPFALRPVNLNRIGLVSDIGDLSFEHVDWLEGKGEAQLETLPGVERQTIKTTWGKMAEGVSSTAAGTIRFGMDHYLLTEHVTARGIGHSGGTSNASYMTVDFLLEVPGHEFDEKQYQHIRKNWVFSEYVRPLKDGKGALTMLFSASAPGVPFVTDQPEVIIKKWRRYPTSGADRIHTVILPTRDGLKVLELSQDNDRIIPASSEDWYVVLWTAMGNYVGDKYLGMLVAGEPDINLAVEKNNQLILKRKIGLGTVVLSTAFDALLSEKYRVNDVAERARQLIGLLRQLPVDCKEYYKIEPDADGNQTVRVVDRYQFKKLPIGQKLPNPLTNPAAPVPPLAAMTAFLQQSLREGNLSVKFSQGVQKTDIRTYLGPYWFVPGNEVMWSISMLNLLSEWPLRTALHPRAATALSAESAQKTKIAFGNTDLTETVPGVWQFPTAAKVLPAWFYCTEEDRQQITKNLTDIKSKIFQPQGWHLAYEPFSSKVYWNMMGEWHTTEPWKGVSWPEPGENAFAFGEWLIGFYYLAAYTGDWNFARDNWQHIDDVFRYAEVMTDWNTMSTQSNVDEQRFYAGGDVHLQGMWSYVAHHLISRELGRSADADRSMYLLARAGLVDFNRWCAQRWFLRTEELFTQNLWTRPARGIIFYHGIAEDGLHFIGNAMRDEKGVLSEQGTGWWAWMIGNSIGPELTSPEHLQFLRWAGGQKFWEQVMAELDRIYPEWKDAASPVHGAGWWGIASIETWLAGYSSNRVWYDIPNDYDEPTKPGAYGERYRPMLISRLMSGDNAPYLCRWSPAIVKDGSFDRTTGLTVIELETSREMELWLASPVPPSSANVDGKQVKIEKVLTRKWNGDDVYAVVVSAGQHRVAIQFPAPPKELPLSYNFDTGENTVLIDDSGFGVSTTVKGKVRYENGKTGKALSLDGVGYLELPSTQHTNASSYTLMTWVWLPKGGGGGLFSKGASDWSNMTPYLVIIKPAGNIFVYATSGTLPDDSGTGRTIKSIHLETPPLVTPETWHHIAIAFNYGEGLKVYVDGQPGGEFAFDRELYHDGSPAAIGCALRTRWHVYGKEADQHPVGYYPTDYFHGKIDAVRLYNRALSQEEVNNQAIEHK